LRSGESDVPPFQPSDESGDSPNLEDLDEDREGKSRFLHGEESKLPPTGIQPKQSTFPLEPPHAGGAEDSRPKQKANLYFKTDRRSFRLASCWQGKFFHRDDMRLPISAISGALDFTIRLGDSTSLQRYKRFLADVHSRFGTLDSRRLVAAIRDQTDRKTLRECYRHIRGNHNDVSLVFWHGPIQVRAVARLNSGARTRGWRFAAGFPECNGGTLLTGDLTCIDRVVQNMEQHFGSRLSGSSFLLVPHHGSLHSWNIRLLTAMPPEVMPVVSAGMSNGYRHPHPQVIDALDHVNGGVRWFVSNERNTVSMHIETI
jgi:hypothetical protein